MKQWMVCAIAVLLVAGCAGAPPQATEGAQAEATANENELYLVVSISNRVVRVFRGDEQREHSRQGATPSYSLHAG